MLWAIASLNPYVFGREGLGSGDIKFLAMIGAFLGWEGVLLTLMIVSIVGAIVGIGLMVVKVIRRGSTSLLVPSWLLAHVWHYSFRMNSSTSTSVLYK